MMITYKWSVAEMEVVPQEDDVTDVVANVYWMLTGTDGQYSGAVRGSVKLQPYAGGQPFIPYEDLTEDVVLGWVFDVLGASVSTYEAQVDQQITAQLSQPVIPRPLPWSSQ